MSSPTPTRSEEQARRPGRPGRAHGPPGGRGPAPGEHFSPGGSARRKKTDPDNSGPDEEHSKVVQAGAIVQSGKRVPAGTTRATRKVRPVFVMRTVGTRRGE